MKQGWSFGLWSKKLLILLLSSCLAIFLGVILVAVPATLTLPGGVRPGIPPMTLESAVLLVENISGTDAERVENARKLVITRMQYCRRNSFDSYEIAFERGYGYCIQQAQALAHLLTKLNLTAYVVQATENRFPDGSVGGHAWVRVETEAWTKDVDATNVSLESDRLTFVPLNEVTRLEGVFLQIALWGSTSVNALRYYLTGSDTT